MASVATATFADRLAEAVDASTASSSSASTPPPTSSRSSSAARRRSAAPAARLRAFCYGIVDAVAPYVVAVKPQSRSSRRSAATGLALEAVCDYARAAGLLVIADAKRGDIGSTARAYAAAYLEPRDERGRWRTRSPSTPISAATPSSPSCRRAG